jgi:hypothetical protein
MGRVVPVPCLGFRAQGRRELEDVGPYKVPMLFLWGGHPEEGLLGHSLLVLLVFFRPFQTVLKGGGVNHNLFVRKSRLILQLNELPFAE